MKAIQIDTFGGVEVLHEAQVDKPEPGPGQVRVRVAVAGVNPVDSKIRSGAMEAAFPTPLPAVLGRELAGTVDAIGDGVTDFAVGDEVLGSSDTGSYAEYALASRITVKPAGLDWPAAVALPVAGETSQRVLDLLGVGAGDTLLIHGAAGAVGTLAVQLAVARGATVIGTASAANHDYLASLGAIPTEYGAGLVERVRALAPNGVDAVFDVAGKGALPDSIELLGGTDRLVTIADPAAFGLGVTFSSGGDSSVDLAGLAESAAKGELVTTIAGTYPLAEAAAAHAVIDAGHARGKLVLTVS
ncbi:MAG TPA: NADP-dependent oxidoreductase [Pseudonocardiaceae bacterium]|jgi:NADPH:quinone reductase-like Zn-dependent oxidoreductase|nr:NADP-dependent oxidoreductase [Pseudonocardiaceae bacterium]